MASIFTKIIAREIPGHFVYEDEHCVVILDKFPAVNGQVLVIPRQEVDYFLDLDEMLYAHVMHVARRVAAALDAVFATERTCLVIEGFDVPHMHVKLYPMQATDRPLGKTMGEPKEAPNDELAALATKIGAALTK